MEEELSPGVTVKWEGGEPPDPQEFAEILERYLDAQFQLLKYRLWEAAQVALATGGRQEIEPVLAPLRRALAAWEQEE